MPLEGANCAEFFKAALTAAAGARGKRRFIALTGLGLTTAAAFIIVPAMNGPLTLCGIGREIIS
jgi:hypothetical protein